MRQKYSEPVCGGLIFNSKDEILLIKSYKQKNKYVIPGGHIMVGEKIEDALKREIKEETGLDIYNIKFVYFYECVYSQEFWKKKHFIFLILFVKQNQKKFNLILKVKNLFELNQKEH